MYRIFNIGGFIRIPNGILTQLKKYNLKNGEALEKFQFYVCRYSFLLIWALQCVL